MGLHCHQSDPIQTARNKLAYECLSISRGVNWDGTQPKLGLCLVQNIYHQLEIWLFKNTHAFTSQRTVSLSSKDHLLKLIHTFAYLQLLIKGDEYRH